MLHWITVIILLTTNLFEHACLCVEQKQKKGVILQQQKTKVWLFQHQHFPALILINPFPDLFLKKPDKTHDTQILNLKWYHTEVSE